MPLAKQFAFLRESVRTHPVITATSAATAGVLLGGFVAFQLLATPQPHSAGAGTAQAAVETKAAPRPAPETTGSAAAGESAAAADCDQQTWPHLSRACMAEYRSKNRAPRVVSTDRLDKSAVMVLDRQYPSSYDTSIQPISTLRTAHAVQLAAMNSQIESVTINGDFFLAKFMVITKTETFKDPENNCETMVCKPTVEAFLMDRHGYVKPAREHGFDYYELNSRLSSVLLQKLSRLYQPLHEIGQDETYLVDEELTEPQKTN